MKVAVIAELGTKFNTLEKLLEKEGIELERYYRATPIPVDSDSLFARPVKSSAYHVAVTNDRVNEFTRLVCPRLWLTWGDPDGREKAWIKESREMNMPVSQDLEQMLVGLLDAVDGVWNVELANNASGLNGKPESNPVTMVYVEELDDYGQAVVSRVKELVEDYKKLLSS